MSYYQKGVFLVRGLSQFTKNGYAKASKSFKEDDLNVDVSGKVFMITGANSGIGKAAALAIAKKGGEIHMVCRNEQRAVDAQKEVVELSKNENIHVHILDMSNALEVKKFALKFESEHSKLNVLINNAGCMVLERKLINSMETNFATNTFGTYLLTEQLIPLLKQSDKPSVITVSSGGMYLQKLDPSNLQSEKGAFDGEMAYARNKRQQVILTEEWAKAHTGIHFTSMHPGWADTPAVQNSMPDFHRRMENKLRSPEEGSDTIVWLAISPAARETPSGAFFQDRKSVGKHLPLAWTKETASQREVFMKYLKEKSAEINV